MPEQVFSDKIKKVSEKLKRIILNPVEFFEEYEPKGPKEVFIYLFILGLIPSLLSPLSTGAFHRMASLLGISFKAAYLSSFLSMYVGIIVFIPIVSLIYHCLIWIVGGREGLVPTFAAVVHAWTPSFLLSWIPLVNLVAGIWSLALGIIGLSKLQNVSYWRAGLAVIILPLILVLGLFSLIFLSIF